MTRDELEALTEDLLFMSETDAPLTYCELAEKMAEHWPPATPEKFLEMIAEDEDEVVTESTPQKFLAALAAGNEDFADQLAALEEMLTGELDELRCYRVGKIEIGIYLLGRDASGKVCGLQTLSVET